MTGLLISLHIIVCILLAVIILMQSGRGGGLTEAFASAETMFGAKTNEVLIKGTTILACLFLFTCLSLAVLSSQKSKSLITEKSVAGAVQEQPVEPAQASKAESIPAETPKAEPTTMPESQTGSVNQPEPAAAGQ